MESIPNEIACIIFSYLPYNYFVQLNLLNKYYNMLCDITLHKTYLNFKCLDDEDIKYALNKFYPTKYNINYEDDDKYLEKLEYALLENYDDTEIINLFLYDKTFYFKSNSNYTNLCIITITS